MRKQTNKQTNKQGEQMFVVLRTFQMFIAFPFAYSVDKINSDRIGWILQQVIKKKRDTRDKKTMEIKIIYI